MNKKQAKEQTPVLEASFKALNHSNISTFDSSIRKFEHFNIRALVITHIIKALQIKNGTIAVHLRRSFIDRKRFINAFAPGVRSENSHQTLSC